MTIIMLNLLIAIIGNSYDKINSAEQEVLKNISFILKNKSSIFFKLPNIY